MKDRKLTGLFGVLIVLSVLLVLSITVIVLLLRLNSRDVLTISPTVSPDAEKLLNASDLEPDPLRLYRSYEGILKNGKGETIELSDWRGQPVLLLFWSSWCEDCKGFLTEGFSDAADAAAELGIPLLLVCREGVRGDDYARASSVLQDMGLQYDTFMDPDGLLYTALGFHSVPGLAVFDGGGRLVLNTNNMPSDTSIRKIIDYARGGQQQLLEAFVRGLIQPDGLMTAKYSIEGGSANAGDVVLSESVGLLMCYALGQQDQALFDLVWRAGYEHLFENGLFAWRAVGGKREDVNSSLDDLRILDALYSASQLWGGDYRTDAAKLAHSLYNGVVSEQIMRDFAHLTDGEMSEQVALCYQDPAAMRRLANLDVRWSGAAAKAEELLKNGIISEEFPLYWPRYDVSLKEYIGDDLHTAEALVTVLHAAQAGLIQETTLKWLEDSLRQGPLYARYSSNGQVLPRYAYESTAVYALAVQIGQFTGHTELTRLALARMERMRCFEGALTGAYGQITDAAFYAYDALQPLLAWQSLSNH